jgi:hypothetical protein
MPSIGDLLRVLLIGVVGLAVMGIVFAGVYLVMDVFVKRSDARWRSKHPGQVRTASADDPLVPYDPSFAPLFIRDVDPDGRPVDPPPRKRDWRSLFR